MAIINKEDVDRIIGETAHKLYFSYLDNYIIDVNSNFTFIIPEKENDQVNIPLGPEKKVIRKLKLTKPH